MINERLRNRLRPDRPSTTITLRIPVDVVETLKAIAPSKGFAGYQTLLKSYVSEGLRRDEALVIEYMTRPLMKALQKRGVRARVLRDAIAEVRGRYVIGKPAGRKRDRV